MPIRHKIKWIIFHVQVFYILFNILEYQNNIFLRKTWKTCVQGKSTETILKKLFCLTSTTTTKNSFFKVF